MPSASVHRSVTPSFPRRRGLLAGLGLVAVLVSGCSSSGDKDTTTTTTTTKPAKVTTTEKATSTTEDGSTTSSGAPSAAAVWTEDAQAHRGQDGEQFTVDCSAEGKADTVWGAGTYTDDSSICTAAVQSGLITLADGGEVTYEIAPGLDEYEAGTANGVTSLRYGSWDGSFTFPDAPPGSVDFTVGVESWDRNASEYAAQVGGDFNVECSPQGRTGALWGSGPYTTDSSVCTAAVHAGLITLAEGGTVTIEIAAGADRYEGTTTNGVTSSSYGAYGSSFVFALRQPGAADRPSA